MTIRYCIDLTAHNTKVRKQGVGRYLYYLAKGLQALKGELRADEELMAAVRLRGANALTTDLCLENNTDPLPPLEHQSKAYERYFGLRWLWLRGTLAKADATVVHFIEGPQALTSGNARSIVSCMDLIPILMPHEYLSPKLTDQAIRRAKDYLRYKTADRIIAISQVTADSLRDTLGIPPSRISVIPLAVDHDRFNLRADPGEADRIRKRYALPAQYVLYVGDCDPRKRVELLLSTYPSVYRATRIPLVVVGGWTRLPPRHIAEKLAGPVAEGAVVPIGPADADDLPALYRNAELHVLPSVYEGFGLTILEAMATGCPVVTTPGGSLREVAGDAAAYAACDSATELEIALIEVLRNSSTRDRLRQAGILQASKFTWEKVARQTLATYRKVAGVEMDVGSFPNAPTQRGVSL